jgi:RNA ligase
MKPFNLASFNHLRSDPRVSFKQETIGDRDVVIVSYMIATEDFWKKEMALETRGPVFCVKTGVCLSRPFEKFFNVNEREETKLDRLDFNMARVFEKRDGSMVVPVLIDGKVYFKTKKSFFSDVALEAQKVADENLLKFSKFICENNLTPIFEFTHPNWQVVINYGPVPKFTLLAVRDNITGNYLDFDIIKKIATVFEVDYIDEVELDRGEILHEMKTRENFEGYVVLLPNQKRVKFKTEWYLRNHRSTTKLRIRDVAEAVVDETVDDLKSSLSLDGKDLAPIEEIERQVVEEINQIRKNTEDLLEEIRLLPSRKEAAMKFGKHENFKLAMKLYDGKEVDFAKVWKERRLKELPLVCVFNQNFGG